MWPSEGSLVVGPMDPATKRGFSGVEYWSATSRARRAAARLSSRVRSWRSYSASTMLAEPKLSVSITSQPASRNDAWMARITSGRDRTSSSLQPFLAPEVVGGQAVLLHTGAHCAVVDQHASFQFLKKIRQSSSWPRWCSMGNSEETACNKDKRIVSALESVRREQGGSGIECGNDKV